MKKNINKNYLKLLLATIFAVVLILLPTSNVDAAIKTSTATGGLWTAGTTWVGGVAPANADSVIIATTGGNSVNIGATTTNAGLTISPGAILTFTGAFTLTENGNVIVNGTINGATGILKMNNNPLAINGSGTINSKILIQQPTSIASTANLTTTAIITLANTFTIASGATLNTIEIDSNARTVVNNGTVNLTGNYLQTGGTAIWTQGTNAVLNIGGTFTPTANVTLNASASGNTVNYNGSARAVEPATYVNLIFSGSGAKAVVTGTSVTGNLSVAPTGSATASIGTGLNIAVQSLTLGGVSQVSGTWGSTSSTATNKINIYFAPTTGIVTVSTGINPVPTITSISPTSKIIGDVGFPLTVNGTNFVSTSVVKFAGTARATTFVSGTQLTAVILTSDLAVAGPYDITVTNPAPGGGTSGPQTFTVAKPLHTTTNISPISKTVGDPTFLLTVNGTNFVSGYVVSFNGNSRATNFVSATQLTATILASDLATGSFPITVIDPSPGGSTSNAQILSVHSIIPSITSIYPPSVAVGSAQFTMTINGIYFDSNSQVKFSGNALTTTYINGNQLTAVVPLLNLISAGTFSISVYNPTTGETSNSQSFTVGSLGRHEFNYSKTFYGSASLKK
jgi:hypothetical protein